jgi:hypothetical protein
MFLNYYFDTFRPQVLAIVTELGSSTPTAAVAASDIPSERGDSSVVGCGRADRPDHDQHHCYHHAPKVKPEAATAVVKLLMMGVRTPETC